MALNHPSIGAPTHITVEYDTRDLAVLLTRDVQTALGRALMAAGGDSIRGSKTLASKRMRLSKRIRLSRVREGLPLIFPEASAKRAGRFLWRMRISGEAIPLIDYSPRQTKKGLTVKINRSGGRKLIKHAFLAKMSSGHKGAYLRRNKERLPIDELFSTNIAQFFNDSTILEPIQKKAERQFTDTFGRVWDSTLGQFKGR